MQTFYQAKRPRSPIWAALGIGAAILFLLIHLDPLAQITCARWQAENPAF
ncbi:MULTISPECIES: hypothetical protein [Thioclava]|uniref:Uncharacterized protein n=1 Tax=Thioclava kandeliae TaxID=3070818 RepID=A0ABV1SKD0_9RHOB